MSVINIAIIAIIQGLTEFLPVSSSGHLVLIPSLLHMPDQGLDMDLAVHIGTLLAVLAYYRHDVWDMAKSIIFFKDASLAPSRKLAIYIVLATIPAIVLGMAMHIMLPEGIRDIKIITATTIIFAIVMGLADKFGKFEIDISGIGLKSAMTIGFAQVLAFIPGTSRSGITMTAARALGIKRTDAARFSFLLSLPATAGAGFFGVLDAVKSGNAALGLDMLLAIVMSFIAGILAIAFMMKFLTKFGLMPFVIYRLILGIALILFIV